MIQDSQQLLAEFAEQGSEAVFQELVARYLNLVYSTALRILNGNTQLAEDVSQAVFLSLAQKGRTLSDKVMLGGWLHKHTFYLATRAARGERRRQSREREAVEMNTLLDDSGARWRQLAPILDEAITELGTQDRAAITLRFFEQRDFQSVGKALGSTPDAARVRVNRALEKLQILLKQRGVALSVTALGSALTAEAVTAAPAGLAVAISTAAWSGAAAGTGLTFSILKIMATTKLKLGVIALAMTGAATTIWMQHQSHIGETQILRQQIAQLESDNEELSNRVTRASAARLLATQGLVNSPVEAIAPTAVPTRSLYSLLTNQTSLVKLTAAQVETYLKENRRSSSSLLAAFRTADDPALLQEAMEKFPNDPQVSFEAALRKDLPAAERRRWLDAFKQSASENALANYLSAADHFKAGQTDQALQDVIAASSKAQFQDYTAERMQTDEEAFRAAGYSVAEAKVLGNSQIALPQLVQMNELSGNLVDLAKSYQQAGDEASRQAALQMAANLGQRYDAGTSGESFLAESIGIRVERAALEAMDPSSAYGTGGGSVQDRLNQLTEQRATMRTLKSQADLIMPTLSEQDWISYQNRSTSLGEEAALHWLVNKHGPN